MATRLKDIYSEHFFTELTQVFASVIDNFDADLFSKKVWNEEWEMRALKDRMQHLSNVMQDFMPENYNAAAQKMKQIISALEQSPLAKETLALMFLPEYVSKNGLGHLRTSCEIMEILTPLTSCEFAVRPFIMAYQEEMMEIMLAWSLHPNHHVRRLASEGCRPRLPWAKALTMFKQDPSPILPILENLKKDDQLYVRKSVANNLNDISKDNPDLFLSLIYRWKNHSTHTDWIIKHASRTLLKAGHKEVFTFFDFEQETKVDIRNLKLSKPDISIGDSLSFEFEVTNNERKFTKIRLGYAVYFLLSNDNYSRKVFSIGEYFVSNQQVLTISKNHSFKILTTRKYYTGTQKIGILLNGVEVETANFELL